MNFGEQVLLVLLSFIFVSCFSMSINAIREDHLWDWLISSSIAGMMFTIITSIVTGIIIGGGAE